MMANCLMADARVNKTNEEQKINTEQHKNQTTNSQIPYFAYNKYTNLCVDQPTEYSLQQVFAFREIIASFISATPIRRALYNGDYYLRRFFFFSPSVSFTFLLLRIPCHWEFWLVYVRTIDVLRHRWISRVIAFKIPIKPKLNRFLIAYWFYRENSPCRRKWSNCMRVLRFGKCSPKKSVSNSPKTLFSSFFHSSVIYLMTYEEMYVPHRTLINFYDYLWHLICCSKEVSVRKWQRHLKNRAWLILRCAALIPSSWFTIRSVGNVEHAIKQNTPPKWYQMNFYWNRMGYSFSRRVKDI